MGVIIIWLNYVVFHMFLVKLRPKKTRCFLVPMKSVLFRALLFGTLVWWFTNPHIRSNQRESISTSHLWMTHLLAYKHYQAYIYGRTKAYLHRFHIIDNPTCTCKKAQQTVNHLIYECPDIGQQRLKLINQIIQNGDSHKSTTNFQALESFLRIC